jgi:hypothetical protein
MANHKHRDVRYKGFVISLDYDPGDYEGIESGWVYSVVNDATGLDHGGSSNRMSFRDAMREAKMTIDEIITEVESYQEEVAEFSGDDEAYLRVEDDPCDDGNRMSIEG